MPRKTRKDPGRGQQSAGDVAGTVTRPVSLKFLAEYLGLSRATVSIVLNDAPVARGLSPKTRERVLRAAEKFNYRPNFFARYLNTKQAFLVAVISPDLGEGYDSTLLAGIQGHLLKSGFFYFVASHQWSEDLVRKLPGMMIDRGAEGVIFINTPLTKRLPVPVVNIGGRNAIPGVTNIVIDNDYGVKLGLEHLVELGHRRIAFFKGHAGSIDTEERWLAIERHSARLGIRLDERLCVQLERMSGTALSAIEEGYCAAHRLLERSRDFTALFAFNDMSAIGAIGAFRDAGLQLPQDVSLIGFDDVTSAAATFPALTTIRQPLRDIGELAAIRLLEYITDRAPSGEKIVVRPELVVRASTARMRLKQ
jgi:DNA-binding LacI/PurR family transcriptional regulator